MASVARNKIAAFSVAAALGLGGLAVAAIPMINGTTANWHDAQTVKGATLTSGNLDVAVAEDQSGWFDVTKGPEHAVKIDPGKFRTVPGDVLDYRAAFAVALHGDSLKAEFKIQTPNALGELLKKGEDEKAGVKLTYDIYRSDDNGAPTGNSLASGTVQGKDTVVSMELTPEQVKLTKIPEKDIKPNYVAVVRAAFDWETPDRNRVNTMAELNDITVSLTQVEPNPATKDGAGNGKTEADQGNKTDDQNGKPNAESGSNTETPSGDGAKTAPAK